MKGPANFVSAADQRAEEILLPGPRQGPPRLRLPRRGRRQPRGHRQDATPGSSTRSTAPTTSCTASRSSRSRSACSATDTIIAGVIYNPANDEIYIAERGKGAFLNDRRMRVAARRGCRRGRAACGAAASWPRQFRRGTAVQDKVAGLRRFWRSGAPDLAYIIAAGRLDCYWERGLSPWDFAAGVADGARSGRVCHGDLKDGERTMEAGRRHHRRNETLHREVLKLIAAARAEADLRRGVGARGVAASVPSLQARFRRIGLQRAELPWRRDLDPFKLSPPRPCSWMLVFLVLCGLVVTVLYKQVDRRLHG